MSLPDQMDALERGDHGNSTKEFLAYCEAERERRINSGKEFDEESFNQAMDLVLRKLKVLEEEGWT
ncbi:nodulation protein E [Candidatus Endoriftia persephone str. Guaymas]|jgi:hypothetical protein|uniref:Nodulation protein E n=4 Tax=Gammaproteobacteria TaxID=1236 RepID=G2FJV2_9GAMM|nr:hypothetical protein [Candidatus Endoriftia persephone]MBA1332404.1 nodulation protein E [Candidatus Endoriftia persephone str. Guaymas]EGV50587.1 hypothetical protein Rifp1Sym_cu00130 [endosymbiont of Riftia pachyptila (vent Ph05)]EGW52924.1 hypothetical protein TevJSym_ca00040 [endosymbiont of Tevnia jerichonana (vent Tica)]KRT54917.1 hypothetical protein Ga0074115_11140 [endosymbiont of Ridgeia piscesae]KRT58215.1 hypothetical protein Ga0076813_13052 [endosymbiont of Ridgeia piscesae]